MKKVLFVAAFAVFGLVSCKKDYTCTCTVDEQTLTIPISKAKKKDAESTCSNAETTYKNADANASCSL